MNNIFEDLAMQEILKKVYSITFITIFGILLLVFAIIFLSRVLKESEDSVDFIKKVFSISSVVMIAQIFLFLALFKTYQSTGLFNSSFSEVAKIKSFNSIEVKVDEELKRIDLTEQDRPEEMKTLSHAIAEAAGQKGFEKILKISKVGADRYEIFYKCTCGKEKSIISSED